MQQIDADMKLVIEIKNNHPIELVDLTSCFASLAAEYRHNLEITHTKVDAKNIKLYVKEVRHGSVITELVALAPAVLPLIEYSKTVLDFAKHIKEWRDFLLGERDCSPSEANKSTLQNITGIIEPIAKDNGSQINISGLTMNGDIHIHTSISSNDANAIQNQCRRLIEEMAEPISGLHTKVAMYLFQARNQIGESIAGDKAIIETISDKPVRLMFDNEQIKQEMLDTDHPFNKAFIVDVVVETVRERPIAYRVRYLHEAIDI